ncbi:amidohydrolase [uncultured Bilophila sp.]|uniref:amidohydrolase n=1 Tax=uncultured Bilophila sp. TaxID=529385 RepID=UPI0026DB40C4|nr:amidohydrolase family protein [uncultured Bilophila sp.]
MRNHMKRHALSFAAAVALVLGGGMQLCAAEKLATTVYHNGTIYTVTEDFHKPSQLDKPDTAEVVATLDGKIVFVGSESEARAKGLLNAANVGNIVDLKGKTMLPGFIDGHSHFPEQGKVDLFQANLNSAPIGKMNSIEDYIVALKERADKTPEGMLVSGWGYDDTLVAERTHPTKEDLDRASSVHPIIIKHTSDHLSAGNSLAFKLAGFDAGDINAKGIYVRKGVEYPGVRTVKKADGTWDFTGVCAETEAMGLLDVPQTAKETIPNEGVRSVARASQIYAAAGVTTVDQGGSVFAMPIPQYGTVGYALNEIQTGLKHGVLGNRVIMHPFGYMVYGAAEIGEINRSVIGWTGAKLDTPPAGPEGTMGGDITSFSLKGIPAEMGGQAPKGLPAERIFMGAWKIIYDGSNQAYTGYFKTPGYYDPSFGDHPAGYTVAPGTSKETLEKMIDLYHGASQSIEVHTNGSWAAENYVTALEKAAAAHPSVKDTRDCAIHAQMMERQHIERLVGDYSKLDVTKDMYTELDGTAVDTDLRDALQNGEVMKKLNTINSYFVNHAYYWGDRHMDIFMGPGRAKNMNPCGWSVAYDQPFSVHNDTKVTPISPLRSMEDAVARISAPTSLGSGGNLISGEGKDLDAQRSYPETKGGELKPFWNYDQRVNVLQALHATTIVPAFQNHMDTKIGSIAPTKFADFTILEQDPFKIDPSGIAEIRVMTTIVDDKPIYGFLPDTDTFAGQIAAGFEQPSGVSVNTFTGNAIDHATAEEEYASLPKGSKRLGTFEFTAEIAGGVNAIFQMNFLGNGASVSELGLYKLHATKVVPYAYGRPSTDEMKTASGKWWIADIDDPTVALKASDTLAPNHTYMAFFIIADNDEDFDVETADGVIKDPVSLATTGALPDNGVSSDGGGSSGGGCTVGSAPAYDLLALFLAFSAVAVVRVVRRRED